MSYEIKILHDPDLDAYIMQYGSADEDIVVLTSRTLFAAAHEAEQIVEEWA